MGLHNETKAMKYTFFKNGTGYNPTVRRGMLAQMVNTYRPERIQRIQ